jgi:dTDP-4-dehydrorhamnose reductase
MRPFLVLGGSGFVGGHIVAAASNARQTVVGTYHSFPVPDLLQLDIRDAKGLTALLSDLRPVVVFLPAACPDVDWCETHPEEAFQTNVDGVRLVTAAANSVDAKLVYISSDFIFDGTSGPYKETDVANPLSAYGRQKLSAEHHIALHARDYLIVRTTVVYGWEHREKNFVCRVIRSLAAGNSLLVPLDQVGTPTFAPNLAEVTVELALANATGVFNVVGPERVSRLRLAEEVASIFGLDARLLRGVTTSQLGQPARRPLDGGLASEKVSSKVRTRLVGYREGLRAMAALRASAP